MALGGDLRNINLADIFQTLSMNRQIGTLVVRNGVKEKRIYFSGSGVSLCSGRTIPGFRLGRYLVGTGKVTEEDLRIALEEQRRTGDLLGKVLVDLELCSTDDVETVIRYHAAEELYEIFGWDRGEFQFLEGSSSDILDRPSPFALTQFDAGSIVMEAARRIDEWERVREAIPTDGDIFIHTGVESSELDEDEWGSDLAGVYQLVDGKLDIGEILDEYHLSVFDTGMILRELVLNGLIRVCDFAELTDAAWRLIDENEIESAARVLERAHGIEPRDTAVLQHLTDCYEKLGEKRAASNTLLKIGGIHLEEEKVEDAIHALEKAEKYDPGGEEAPVQLMRSYRLQGDLATFAEKARAAASIFCEREAFDRAIEVCQEGLEEVPDHLALRTVLANAHLGSGHRDLALKELEEIAATLEETRNIRKLEEVYRKILQLDSSRKEILQRLQDLKDGSIKRRKKLVMYAASAAGGVILLVFSLFLITSGTSASDKMAEATTLFHAGDHEAAKALALAVKNDDPNSDEGFAATNLLAAIDRARSDALSPKDRNEHELVKAIDKWFVPASKHFNEGTFHDGFDELRKLLEYLKSPAYIALARQAGPQSEKKIVDEYRKNVDSLLKAFAARLERSESNGQNDLRSVAGVRPVDELKDIREACSVIARVMKDSSHETWSWEVSAAGLIESEIGLPDGKVATKLRAVTQSLDALHKEASGRYHTLRAIVRRAELIEGFSAANTQVGDLLNEGKLAAARDLCQAFIGDCKELQGETPLSAYEAVIAEVLGDDGLDLDGMMKTESDLIDEVLGAIERGEELIDQGKYEEANQVFRQIIGGNFRIDFSQLVGLVMHIRTRPAGAEVHIRPQGKSMRLLGQVPAEGLTVRYPPYGTTTIVVHKPSYERVEIAIADFNDEKPSAPVIQLKKLPAWRAADGGAMEATPAFRAGKVVVPARDGHVRVFKASNGDVLHDHDTELLNGFGATPLLLGDVIILGSLDERLLALSLQSGNTVWEYPTGKRVRSDPVLAGDLVVYVDTDGTLAAVRNGTLAWSLKLDGRVTGDLASSDGSVYVGTTEGTLYRVNSATGEVVYQVSLGGRISSTPTPDAEGRIYVGTDKSQLIALRMKDGEELYRFAADNAVRGRAAVLDGRVFFATLGGTIYQLRAVSGEEVNHVSLPDGVPVETGVVAGSMKVYATDATGMLRCICPSSGVLWTYRLDGKAASPPLFHEGYLYVATEAGGVYCFKE